MTGWIVTRNAKDGSKRYDACWRVGKKIKSRTFSRKKDADTYLTRTVQRVHEGTYVEIRPTLMGEVFDRWLEHAVDVGVNDGTLKPSTAKSYRSMIRKHLRPAFAAYRSDHFTLGVVEEWRAGVAEKIAAGTLAPKFYVNLRNLLHDVITWARNPARRYLVHDPLDGLPKLKLPKAKKRPHFEPEQVAELLRLAGETPPDDTIIALAVYSGLRRGELFGLQWNDIDAGDGQDGGRLHVRRSIYQGAVTTPKTADSDRAVDVPQRLLDDLAVYRVMYPEITPGFVFRGPQGQPLDPDTWHREHLVPLLDRAKLRLPGTGLHSIRHTYVSLLISQGETPRYIADQVGHASTKLTMDLYAHVFKSSGRGAMRKLGASIPSSNRPAEQDLNRVSGES